MRKANQSNTPGTLVIEGSSLEAAVAHLDVNSKARREKERFIERIKRSRTDYKREITRMSKQLSRTDDEEKKAKAELAVMPDAMLSLEGARSMFETIAKLPWVGEVKLINGDLIITTRSGVLQTTFYDRVAYSGGRHQVELLEAPLVLPMPTYQLYLRLSAMGQPGAWDRSSALQIRLAEPRSLAFMPDARAFGMSQAGYAHWATYEQPVMGPKGPAEAVWGDLCLNRYREVFDKTNKAGLLDFLNEVVIFLQGAGWANAYRPKLTWAITLGFQPYTDNLTRPLLASESFEGIQSDRRQRMTAFLVANGLTQHMYDYGSMADGEDAVEMNGMLRDQVRDAFNANMVNPAQSAYTTWNDIAQGTVGHVILGGNLVVDEAAPMFDDDSEELSDVAPF